MRRLPIYFLIDVSESMAGVPIEEVQKGMKNIVQDLRTNPYALENVHIGIIAFAGKAKILSPLTEIFKFYPPVFPLGGGTSLGAGLNMLMDDIDKSVVKTTVEQKGDWKPIVFLFTDGTPTDNPDAAINRWNSKFRKRANIIAISIGNNANTQLLGKISDNVLRLNDTDEHSFQQFFKWITASVSTASFSVGEQGDDSVHLAPTGGINLEKVDTSQPCNVDDNYVVIRGKCSETKKQYLLKYAKEFGDYFKPQFKIVGSYAIDGESYEALSDGKSKNSFNVNQLEGFPSCPCCGNRWAFIVCECGNVFCAGDKPVCKCPWCGMEGEISAVGSEGINVNRGQG